MAAIDLKQLVGRLNDLCRRALEAAAGMTLSRTHYNVEIEHWLLALADRADCDVAAILRQYEIDQGRFVTDLNHALEKLKTERADLVLTDMRMPGGMNGLVLAEKLRARKPSLKVIIMSGYNSDMVTGSPAGSVDFTYLEKPFRLGGVWGGAAEKGADANLANLRLGEALARAGDKPGATAALSKVGGSLADAAKFWLVYVQHG